MQDAVGFGPTFYRKYIRRLITAGLERGLLRGSLGTSCLFFFAKNETLSDLVVFRLIIDYIIFVPCSRLYL